MPDGLLRHWIEPQPVELPVELADGIGGHPLVAKILAQRGIRTAAQAQSFLNPDFYQPTGPEALPGMVAACQRIETALAAGESVCVWGDFDVDGQTSTTLLVSGLRGLEGACDESRISYHIPVRARESHGVNIENLAPILDSGVRLVVTCDTGIGALEAVAYARQRGVDFVITDHHEVPATLPEACAIVNPKLLPRDHPFAGFAGVCVAYKLIEALYQRAGRVAEIGKFLDLVAMGIVADVALQTDDTRYLLQRGLPALRATQRVGLLTMMEMAGVSPAYLTEEHIGFVLGPRMNALGRLDDANPAVELLTTEDTGRARVLATHLEGLNARRRLLTGAVLRSALVQLEADPHLLQEAALVLAHPDWPAGVIGIVASELVERYNRPTILLAAPPGEPARGSARSIEGVDITQAIAAQSRLLMNYGGHPMAAGLALDAGNITAFRKGLSRFVSRALGGAAPRPSLIIDSKLLLRDLALELVDALERLAPFGPGNPALTFAIPRLVIHSSSVIGREGDHIQCIVKDETGATQRVIWWRGAGWPLPEGMFDLACTVRASNYRGQRELQVEWVDARPMGEGTISLRAPVVIIDQRDQTHPLPVLREMQSETSALVWAEADAIEQLPGTLDRTQLRPADTLIIWTTPPGWPELKAALDAVKPKTVVIFGIDPAAATPAQFLKRLSGLVKFAVDKKNGSVTLVQLAAATGQREPAVRLGLQWLAERGMLRVQTLDSTVLQLAAGPFPAGAGADALLTQLQMLLEETTAYRGYFRTAQKENLL